MKLRFVSGRGTAVVCALFALASTWSVAGAAGANRAGASVEHRRIVEYWTPERVAAARPRDLVIDERGQGYLRGTDGSLQPYGGQVAAANPSSPAPKARPVGDSTAPSISNRDPASGVTIGAAYTFKATVTDASGVRSVTFRVGRAGSATQSFSAAQGANNVWSVQLSGFTDGDWQWSVVAKDKASNTTTSDTLGFKVSTGGGGGAGNVVTSAQYTGGGDIQTALGRIYFEMPSNAQRTRWAGYVCSGTVVTDSTSGRSIIQTAAHCVYDDSNKAFARNVLFIPNQAGTTGTGTDLNCSNDPLGCWTPWFGVVDVNWTTRTFPDNVAWDYAYYVVHDSGAHTGNGGDSALDVTAKSIPISFGVPFFDVANSSSDYTTALGYSYSEDPKLMYCAQDMAQLDSANWWLGSCGLTGGSSGGAWMQPFSGGTGYLISVNSWGYTNQPGMAGPKLSGTSASCVFTNAQSGSVATTTDGDEGIKVTSCP